MNRIAIVIPTRNRLGHLDRLLDSITTCLETPSQVVIVSSGQDASEVVERYQSRLTISHAHLEERGQIRQKMAAVNLLRSDIEWVFFCDDDLLFRSSTIQSMRRSIQNSERLSAVGIGAKIENFAGTSIIEKSRLISRLFGLANAGIGKVNAFGLNSSYQSSPELCVTEWLNGASLWKASVARTYSIPFLDAQYSIYEDLIFSYPVGKKNTLIFDPRLAINYQSEETSDITNRQLFASKSYWRFYFVKSNPEFSILLFFWSQVGVTLQYIHSTFKSGLGVSRESLFAIKLLIDIAFLIISRCAPLTILRKRLRGKSF
jgi:glycosyltransferase involved in cell wall biosynthesis